MRYPVVLLAASLAGVLLIAPATSAASGPGWTLAKASAYIEFNLRLSDPELVTQAQEALRLAKGIGGPNGIAAAGEP
jgi:hypothetical protein